MDLLQGLTDDQTALLGCAAALFVCIGAMVVSHPLRQYFRGTSAEEAVRTSPPPTAPFAAESDAREKKAA